MNRSCTTTNASRAPSAALFSGFAPTTHSTSRSGAASICCTAHAAVARDNAHVERAARVGIIHQANVLHRNAQRIAECHQLADGVALDRIAEHDHEVAFGFQLVAQRLDAGQFPARGDTNAGHGLLVFANRTRGDRIDVRVVMAHVRASLIRQKWMLLRKIRTRPPEPPWPCTRSPVVASASCLARRAHRTTSPDRRCDGDRCSSFPDPAARTSAENNSLRWWCDSTRSRRTCRRAL